MTITLTREEAQQVLDALDEYRDSTEDFRVANKCISLIETLRARLSAPEPSIVEDAIVYGTGITMGGKRIDPASIYKEPEPQPMRLRRGDILRCVETNELCTVWATSTTGKTQVKWKANDFGSYTAEQIGDLFWVEPKPEPEPVACPFPCGWKTMLSIIFKDGGFLARSLIEGEPVTGHQREIVMRLIDYARTMASHGITAPPQREWQGLTEAERLDILDAEITTQSTEHFALAQAIEAKLKEKNT